MSTTNQNGQALGSLISSLYVHCLDVLDALQRIWTSRKFTIQVSCCSETASWSIHSKLSSILVRQVPRVGQIKVSQQIENFFKENHSEHYITHQVVYDANYLSLLVEDKEKCLDTIEYLQKQQGGSQSSQCPTTRKGFLRIVGEKVNSIDFYTSKYNRLIEEVPHSCSLISLVAYYFCARNLFHSVGSRCFQHICACFRILHYCTKYLSKDKYTMHKTV